jgi:N,N-dimethylformamidase
MVRTIGECVPQSVVPGSYGVANLGDALERLGSLTVIATICPTRIGGEGRPILSAFSTHGSGFGLAVDKDGAACASISGSDGVTSVSTGVAVPDGTWARVWMTWNATASAVTVGQQALVRGRPSGQGILVTSRHGGPMLAGGPHDLIGASEADGRRVTFNGRIERPMLFDRVLDASEMARAMQGELLPGLVACWDFSREISGTRIIDNGPHRFHGTVQNMPTRAVTGSTWSGREMCWRHAPDEYAAIHFHDDDIVDCRWPATH